MCCPPPFCTYMPKAAAYGAVLLKMPEHNHCYVTDSSTVLQLPATPPPPQTDAYAMPHAMPYSQYQFRGVQQPLTAKPQPTCQSRPCQNRADRNPPCSSRPCNNETGSLLSLTNHWWCGVDDVTQQPTVAQDIKTCSRWPAFDTYPTFCTGCVLLCLSGLARPALRASQQAPELSLEAKDSCKSHAVAQLY